MKLAFVNGGSLNVRGVSAAKNTTQKVVCPRMATGQAKEVVDEYFPTYERNRAPTISFDGEKGVSLSMAPIQAFTEVDRNEAPLFDYSSEDDFKPNKSVPPSPISWPSGDGRGKPCQGYLSEFIQPNLKEYGPFPDFYKVSFDIT